MTGASAHRVRRPLLVVGGLVALLSGASRDARPAPTAAASRCLTPSAERALRETIAQPDLGRVLGSTLTLQRLGLHDDQIDLEVQDRTDRAYGITLVLPESKRGAPDAAGNRFLFYLAPAPSPVPPEVRTALLAAAAIVDQAIPDAALVPCRQHPADEKQRAPDRPSAERGVPLALALASAGLQVVVLVAAILFGLRAVRPNLPGEPP